MDIPPATDRGRTVEIRIAPSVLDEGSTILAFYDPSQPRHFAIHKSSDDLKLSVESSDAWRYSDGGALYVGGAFRSEMMTLWAIAMDPSGTTIYRDGAKVIEAPGFRVSRQETAGRLIIGNSPIYDDSWWGIFGGVAIFNRKLSVDEVSRHYRSWITRGSPQISDDDACVGLYLLREGSGSIIHNEVSGGPDLKIPAKYMVVH